MNTALVSLEALATEIASADQAYIDQFVQSGQAPGGVDGASRFLLAVALRKFTTAQFASQTGISTAMAEHLLAWVREGAPVSAAVNSYHGLSPAQQAHVQAAFAGCRDEMADYLSRGVDVVIYHQDECRGDTPPYAVAPVEKTEFWISCWDTPALAAAGAKALGLNVVTND